MMSILGDVVVTPSLPQVCRSDDGAITGAAEESADKAAVANAKADQQRRHQSWVKRKAPDGKAATWKPAKRYRVSAKHWLQNPDNQLKMSTQTGGVAFFKKQGAGIQWGVMTKG